MENSEKSRFGQAIAAMGAVLNREINDALIEGYWLVLRDLPIIDFQRGIARAMAESKFFPAPVELLKLAGESTKARIASDAFDVVAKAISAHGGRASVDFDDHLINGVIRSLGGWPKLCATDSKEFHKWKRKEFEEKYIEYETNPPGENKCAALAGIDRGDFVQVQCIASKNGDRPKRLKPREEKLEFDGPPADASVERARKVLSEVVAQIEGME